MTKMPFPDLGAGDQLKAKVKLEKLVSAP